MLTLTRHTNSALSPSLFCSCFRYLPVRRNTSHPSLRFWNLSQTSPCLFFSTVKGSYCADCNQPCPHGSFFGLAILKIRAKTKRIDPFCISSGHLMIQCMCDVAGARDHPDVVESFMNLHAQVGLFFYSGPCFTIIAL